MVAALTADGSEAINRKLESTHISSSESSYFSSFYSSSYFEVEKTVSWLLDTDFNNKAVSSSSVPLRIALQFPDSLLPYAQSVINDITGGLIEKEEKSTAKTPGFQFYLLADTSYSR